MRAIFATFVVGCAFVLGLSLRTVFPNKPDDYTIRAKTRCLTDEGVSWTMKYNGVGEVTYHVLPPAPATPEKEKK